MDRNLPDGCTVADCDRALGHTEHTESQQDFGDRLRYAVEEAGQDPDDLTEHRIEGLWLDWMEGWLTEKDAAERAIEECQERSEAAGR